jgi:hypothetical protein
VRIKDELAQETIPAIRPVGPASDDAGGEPQAAGYDGLPELGYLVAVFEYALHPDLTADDPMPGNEGAEP